MTLEQFAETRGFTEEELMKYGIEMGEGGEVRIPMLGSRGLEQPWGWRLHRPQGRPKYRNEYEGLGHHLYNPLGLGPQSDEVWFAEGEFDTLSLITVGAPAVGVLGAAGFKKEWALLFSHALVVVALDPDSEGDEQVTRVRTLMSLFPRVQRFDSEREGHYMDINDWFKADRDDLEKAVRNW